MRERSSIRLVSCRLVLLYSMYKLFHLFFFLIWVSLDLLSNRAILLRWWPLKPRKLKTNLNGFQHKTCGSKPTRIRLYQVPGGKNFFINCRVWKAFIIISKLVRVRPPCTWHLKKKKEIYKEGVEIKNCERGRFSLSTYRNVP